MMMEDRATASRNSYSSSSGIVEWRGVEVGRGVVVVGVVVDAVVAGLVIFQYSSCHPPLRHHPHLELCPRMRQGQ